MAVVPGFRRREDLKREFSEREVRGDRLRGRWRAVRVRRSEREARGVSEGCGVVGWPPGMSQGPSIEYVRRGGQMLARLCRESAFPDFVRELR